MESVDWRKIMAFSFSARKLIRTKSHKPSWECVVGGGRLWKGLQRGSRNFFVYFGSALAVEVDTLVSSVLVLSSVAVRHFGEIFQSERTICAVTTDTRSGFNTSFISSWMNEGSKYQKILEKEPNLMCKTDKKTRNCTISLPRDKMSHRSCELIVDFKGQKHLRKERKLKANDSWKIKLKTRNRVIYLTRDEISRHFERKMKVVNQMTKRRQKQASYFAISRSFQLC